MPFEDLKGYKTAYSILLPVVIGIIACSFIFSGWVYYDSQKKIEESKKNMLAIDTYGNVYTASYREYSKDDRKIEYEGAVEDFYKLWYQIDEGSFTANINNGLYLLGKCGTRMKAEYVNNKLHDRLKSENMHISVKITKIDIDMSSSPVKGRCYAIQTIRGGDVTVNLNLNSSFTLYDVDRHDKNRHGVKIEDFNVTDNSLVENQ